MWQKKIQINIWIYTKLWMVAKYTCFCTFTTISDHICYQRARARHKPEFIHEIHRHIRLCDQFHIHIIKYTLSTCEITFTLMAHYQRITYSFPLAAQTNECRKNQFGVQMSDKVICCLLLSLSLCVCTVYYRSKVRNYLWSAVTILKLIYCVVPCESLLADPNTIKPTTFHTECVADFQKIFYFVWISHCEIRTSFHVPTFRATVYV